MLVCLTGITSPALAQGEHSRRAGAELRVMAGDVKLLTTLTNNDTDALQQEGLGSRIRGALAAIDILMRLADQEAGRDARSYKNAVHTALEHLDNNRLAELGKILSGLTINLPLVQPSYQPTDVSIKAARGLHQQQCAACHDHPNRKVARPAYNLYTQISSMPEIEFYARMLVGVRGDRVTGIDNPLTDAQIASLIAVYREGQ